MRALLKPVLFALVPVLLLVGWLPASVLAAYLSDAILAAWRLRVWPSTSLEVAAALGRALWQQTVGFLIVLVAGPTVCLLGLSACLPLRYWLNTATAAAVVLWFLTYFVATGPMSSVLALVPD